MNSIHLSTTRSSISAPNGSERRYLQIVVLYNSCKRRESINSHETRYEPVDKLDWFDQMSIHLVEHHFEYQEDFVEFVQFVPEH